MVSVVAVGALGGSAIAQDRTSWLNDGESSQTTGYLLEGESVYATCDADCTDLDLFLYDEYGTMVDSDSELDSFPVVTAPYEGSFIVEASMPSCTSVAGCAVTVSSDYGF